WPQGGGRGRRVAGAAPVPGDARMHARAGLLHRAARGGRRDGGPAAHRQRRETRHRHGLEGRLGPRAARRLRGRDAAEGGEVAKKGTDLFSATPAGRPAVVVENRSVPFFSTIPPWNAISTTPS